MIVSTKDKNVQIKYTIIFQTLMWVYMIKLKGGKSAVYFISAATPSVVNLSTLIVILNTFSVNSKTIGQLALVNCKSVWISVC